MKAVFTFLMAALLPVFAEASVKVFDNTGKDLGHFTSLQCGTNLSCAQVSGKARFTLSQNPVGLLQSRETVSGDLTIGDCGKTVVNNGAAADYTLPSISNDLALGCRLTFIVDSAHALTIDPATAQEQILLLTNAGGDRIQADAAGESVVLEAVTGGLTPKWAPVGAEKGTWSDVD